MTYYVTPDGVAFTELEKAPNGNFYLGLRTLDSNNIRIDYASGPTFRPGHLCSETVISHSPSVFIESVPVCTSDPFTPICNLRPLGLEGPHGSMLSFGELITSGYFEELGEDEQPNTGEASSPEEERGQQLERDISFSERSVSRCLEQPIILPRANSFVIVSMNNLKGPDR